MIVALELQVGHEPDNGHGQRDEQNNKNDPAFTSLLTHSAGPPRCAYFVSVAFIL
jgi:hypothetical protein